MAPKQVMADLDRAVQHAAEFFTDADENLFDGHQSARAVISHFVFWHREYVRIANALAYRRTPRLKAGKFHEFNAQATEMFARQSLPTLARRLAQLQCELARALLRLPDWRADFPLKEGVQYCSASKRVSQIAAHIRNHVSRLKRAERRDKRHA